MPETMGSGAHEYNAGQDAVARRLAELRQEVTPGAPTEISPEPSWPEIHNMDADSLERELFDTITDIKNDPDLQARTVTDPATATDRDYYIAAQSLMIERRLGRDWVENDRRQSHESGLPEYYGTSTMVEQALGHARSERQTSTGQFYSDIFPQGEYHSDSASR